jgi:hypothetical protein
MAKARQVNNLLLLVLLGLVVLFIPGVWVYFTREAPARLEAQFPTGVETQFILKYDASTTPRPTERVLFNVDPKGKPCLLIGRNILAARYSADSDAKLYRLPGSQILSDFAWMHGGSLLLIEGKNLVLLTAEGLEPIQALPRAGMRLAPASPDACYLFGGDTPEQQRKLYLYRQGGKLLYLLQAEAPITAVAGNGEATFVAIDRAIYLLALGNPLTLILRTQDPVTALAIGPDSSLFFSTSAGVGFSSGPESGYLFVRGQGAEIQVRGEVLYLYFPRTGIMKCSPASLFLKTAEANLARVKK